MKHIVVILCLSLAVLAVGLAPASGQILFVKNPNIGKIAEEFTLKNLGGKEASLSELRMGSKAIVFFWATWCPMCRETLRKLPDRLKDLKKDDIKLVLVDIGESEEAVRKYVERYKVEMDVYVDEEGKVADDYGIFGLPTFYYIGEDGVVRNVLNVLPEDLENVFYGL